VALSGDRVVLGAWAADNGDLDESGSVYVYEVPKALGTRYCTAISNSSGSPAAMDASGSASLAANDLVLSAAPLPASHNGLFIYSPDPTQVPLGNGNLCIGNQTLGFVLRLPAETSDGSGLITHALDLTAPPDPLGLITPGSTWHFSCWFRDVPAGGAFFNFADGYTITLAP